MEYIIEDEEKIIWVNHKNGDNYAKLFVGYDHPVMMEAAEILKAFFEAKESGKVARLVVHTGELHGWQDAMKQRPKNTVIDEMNAAGDKATAGIDMLKYFSEKELQEYKDIVSRHYAQYHESAKSAVIGEMNDDAANYQPCLNCKNPIYCQWGKKCSPGNTADSIADRIWGNRVHDMTLEQYEAFTIAHNAALIFAHNAHDFDERRSVQSAAKILKHAQEGQ